MTDDEIHPMQVPPEYDDEVARQSLRRQLEVAVWDAKEGHLDEGDAVTVNEPRLLSPDVFEGPEDSDFVWNLTYRGGQAFEVFDPDGESRGEVQFEDDEELLNVFGEATVNFYRERQIEKVPERLQEVGGSVGLPVCRSLQLVDQGKIGIVLPQAGRDPEPDKVVAKEDLTVEVVEELVEDWRGDI